MIGFLRTLFSSGPPFDDSVLAAGYESVESMPAGSASRRVIVFRRAGLQLTFALLLAVPGFAFLGATLSPYLLWYGRVPAGLACVGVAVLIWRIGGDLRDALRRPDVLLRHTAERTGETRRSSNSTNCGRRGPGRAGPGFGRRLMVVEGR